MRLTTYKLIFDGEERIPSLVKENAKNYPMFTGVNNPNTAVEILNAVFEANKQAEEHCYMIALRSNRIVGIFEVSHGTLNLAVITPKELMTRLFLVSATSFILAHNHPSGEAKPSADDRKLTKKMLEAGRIMGMDFLDHIIIGENDTDFYSFKENADVFIH